MVTHLQEGGFAWAVVTMDSKPPQVVGLGELLWDLLPEGKRFGGAPANFAHHANQLGMAGWVCSAVGSDELADPLLEALEGLGLRACVERVEADTGTVQVHLDAEGQPDYVIAQNVAWDHIPFTDSVAALAAQAQAVCFGTLAQRHPVSRRTIGRFLAATSADCLKVFDVNLRQNHWDGQVLAHSCQAADLLKLNSDEWQVFRDTFGLAGSFDQAAEQLCDRFNLRWVLLTQGDQGSRLHSPEGRWHVAAVPVRVVDAVGAGDAFTAALVCGLLQNRPMAQVLDHAARVAAFVCTQSGATPLLPEDLLSLNAA